MQRRADLPERSRHTTRFVWFLSYTVREAHEIPRETFEVSFQTEPRRLRFVFMTDIPGPSHGQLTLLHTLNGHEERVWHADWCVCQGRVVLATCSADRRIALWQVPPDAGAPVLLETLDGSHTGTVRHVAFSPDGRLLASASFDKTVVVWGVARGGGGDASDEAVDDIVDNDDDDGAFNESLPLTILEGHESEVKGVAWNPNGGMLATCGRDKTVWFWEQSECGRGTDAFLELDFEVIDVKHGHTQDVKTVAWDPSGEMLVSVSYDDSIKVWRESEDTDEWVCACTVEHAHESTVWDVRFVGDDSVPAEAAAAAGPSSRSPRSSQQMHMVTCGDDRCVKVWEVFQEQAGDDFGSASTVVRCVATLRGLHDRPVYSVDVLRRGDKLLVASGGGDDSIVVVEVDVGGGVGDGDGAGSSEVKAVVPSAHAQDVNCVRWLPQMVGGGAGEMLTLASCGDDGDVRLWGLLA